MNLPKDFSNQTDEGFFIEVRSRKVDDVLAGRMSYNDYFDEVDRRARRRAEEDEQADAIKKAQLESFLRWTVRVLVGLGVALALVYLVIVLVSFSGPGNLLVRWLSIVSAGVAATGSYLVGAKFTFGMRKKRNDRSE